MTTRTILLATLILGCAARPATAWFPEPDGPTWPIFTFHKYGGDVNRPAATPDRPYFHGDDAVPLGMRWRDLDEAKAEAAAEDAAIAASVAASGPPRVDRPHVAIHRVRRHVVRSRPTICVPAIAGR